MYCDDVTLMHMYKTDVLKDRARTHPGIPIGLRNFGCVLTTSTHPSPSLTPPQNMAVVGLVYMTNLR